MVITFCQLPSVPAPSNRQVVLASKEVSNCGQSLHFISRRLRSTAWVISCFLFNDWDKSATRGPGLPVGEDDGSNDGDDANVDDGYDDDDDDDDDDDGDDGYDDDDGDDGYDDDDDDDDEDGDKDSDINNDIAVIMMMIMMNDDNYSGDDGYVDDDGYDDDEEDEGNMRIDIRYLWYSPRSFISHPTTLNESINSS